MKPADAMREMAGAPDFQALIRRQMRVTLAAAALQGMLARPNSAPPICPAHALPKSPDAYVASAVLYADLMLDKLEGKS